MVGSPAALEQALAEEVRRHKADDPLAPVTILVGNTLLRPYLRLRLAELLGGWINIEFLTFADLGEKLGQMALLEEGRMPMPSLAEQVLVRQIAAEARGYFKPVAEAPGFPPALQRLFTELGQASVEPKALAEADPSEKVEELADLFQSYRARRAGYYDPFDCLANADPARLRSRALLVHGVWQTTAVQRRVIEELMSVSDVSFFLPDTGTDADFAHHEIRAWIGGIGVEPEVVEDGTSGAAALDHLRAHLFTTNGAAPQDQSVRLVSAPDAPREVVEAARACMTWAGDGIRFHEIAIAYRHDDPYRALVESIFDDSGIPIYLHDGTPIVERPLGRRALALLDLIDTPRPFLRSAVMEFLTDADLPKATRERYGPRPARWDEISRKAGIVEGREQWRERLRAFGEEQESRSAEYEAAREDEPDEPESGEEEGEDKRNRYEWRKHDAENLARFIEDLADKLEARPARAPWSVQVAYLGELFDTYIHGIEPIMDELARLAQLDEVSGEVGFEQFRTVVRQAITDMRAEDPPGKQRGGFAREGVNVLDINSLRHLRFKAVVVLGLSERSFPPPPRQDALLLDDERAALTDRRGWQIPLRAGGPDQEPLQFALAIHAAAERLQLGFARTELGDQRAKLPSHFFRAAAAVLVGEPVSVDRVETGRLPEHVFTRVPGSRFAAPSAEEALTGSEYDRTLLTGDAEQRALGLAVVSRLKPALERSRLAYTSRWQSRTLTTYDGLLGEPSREALAERGGLGRVLSASTIETYATCPYRYFLERVLWIRTEEEPDRIERISPLERGSLVHEILDDFLTELGDDDQPSAKHRDRHLGQLRAVADTKCRDWQQHGLTGLAVLWQFDRGRIWQDLEHWYDQELVQTERFDHGRFELRFGFGAEDDPKQGPLEIDVEGARLRFRGIIDRLNWKADESAFRVMDYKTGKPDRELEDGALLGGRALQLPLYLKAAARFLGLPAERGRAEYYYVTTKGGFERITFEGSELVAREEQLQHVLSELASGIARGDFHPVPGKKRYGEPVNCTYCDYKHLCDARIGLLAERKAQDPAAVAFAKLAEDAP